ncbi:hypothetical protein DDP54_11450 [Cellulomonas sp. WB94]|uniref:hypothetical protein n=1 Tax=Cellulomonas sp. WB94 TaxID=2173174 RepID=UPI000D574FA9|nr:hypothetical protein [Cellulomonas sp. WB94]PVU83510.1 hypothetical protein DDP54_11450 [Cellulomonas sp. WB94]
MRGLVVGGALVAVTVLAGCSGQPGAAALVDGTAISVADVQTATTELAPLYQGVTPAAVLQVLVHERATTAVASEQGVGVNDQQAADALNAIGAQLPAVGERTYSAPTLAVERYLMANTLLQGLETADAIGTELQERIAAQKVEISPRFGTLADGATITDTVHPWLVAPTAG